MVEGHGIDTTLTAWEEHLAAYAREVNILGEIPLREVDIHEIGTLLRLVVEAFRLPSEEAASSYVAIEVLRVLCPVTLATYMAFVAARNEERAYWPTLTRSLGLVNAPHIQQALGQIFGDVIHQYHLRSFEKVHGYKYVTPIRLHGGIPAYSLPDFFEHILRPAIERPEYAGLAPKELLNAVLQRSEAQYLVDRAVRLFLLEAGDVAVDFFRRCLDMARAWKSTGEIPPAEEVGLPTYVVDTFHDFVEGRVEAQRGTRLRPPRLYLDPLAPDALYFIDLPPQPIAASQTEWRYTWRWEVRTPTGQARRGETQVRVTRQGDKFWTHAVKMVPLDVPPGTLLVSFEGYPPEGTACVLKRWRFPLVPDERRPVLAFRAGDGRFLSPRATIPADDVWLLIPAGARVQVIGQGRQIEIFPQRYGEWGAWRVEAWDLSEAQGIRLVDDQDQDMVPPIPTGRARVDPALIPAFISPWHEFDPEERPLFVGTVPKLALPRVTALSPREEMARWQVEVNRHGLVVPSPCVPRSSLLDLEEHVEVQDRAFLLNLDRVLGDDIAGIYEVVVRGPSRIEKRLLFRVWPRAEVESLPSYILPGRKGHTDVTFRLRLPPEAVVRVQSGVDDVSVSSADEPGTFRVQVGKERSIVPLLLIRDRDTGLQDRVPIHIGIPRLRWLLALDGEEDLAQPQASVISRPTAELLQSRRVFLIMDWTVSVLPDQLPPMRLELVDPSEGGPYVLQQYDVDKPRRGQHRQVVPLGPFMDTIRAHRDLPLLSFELVVLETLLQRLPLVHLTRALDIYEVHIEWREDGRVYIHWHEPRPLRHRRLNLWPVSQPWRSPVQVPVPDIVPKSDTYEGEGWWMHDIGSHTDIPPGVYRVSFSTAHPWEPPETPPQPPEEAFLVVGVDVEARLCALETEASTASDPFLVHFERAALYDYLGHQPRRNEAVRVLLDRLPAATPEQIVILVKWLESRDSLAFKEARITMYRAQILEAKGILSEEIQPSLRRAYMQWFVQTRLLGVDTLERVLTRPGDVEWKVHALEVLLKKEVEKAVFYGLLLLEEGTLTAEDLISIFATAADDVVRELRRGYPEQKDLIEALIPHLTNLIVFREGALLETDAGVGTIAEIQVDGRSVPWAFLDENNLILRVRLEEEETFTEVEIDCTRKCIRFPGAKQLFVCKRCEKFVATSYSVVDKHHKRVHPGPGFTFVPVPGNEWQLKGPLRVLGLSRSAGQGKNQP